MTTRNINPNLDASGLTRAFETLAMRLRANAADPQEIVVCGGSALILAGVVSRTTQNDELVSASRWAMTHDVSEAFQTILKNLLGSIGHDEAADRL